MNPRARVCTDVGGTFTDLVFTETDPASGRQTIRIAKVDTTDVPPMTHAVPKDMELRADVVEPSLPASEALAAAPKREGDLFVVNAIISPQGDGDS